MAVPLLMRDAIVHLSSRLSIDVVCYDDGRRRRPGVRRRDSLDSGGIGMAVQGYGGQHLALQGGDAQKAPGFFFHVFYLEMLRGGGGGGRGKMGAAPFFA